jgi:hypothetical protein
MIKPAATRALQQKDSKPSKWTGPSTGTYKYRFAVHFATLVHMLRVAQWKATKDGPVSYAHSPLVHLGCHCNKQIAVFRQVEGKTRVYHQFVGMHLCLPPSCRNASPFQATFQNEKLDSK